MGNPRSLLARYRQLGLWGRISVWGSFASIIGLWLFFLWPQTPSVNQSSNLNQSTGSTIIQSGRDTVINGSGARSQSIRIKYSNKQVITISNVPGDYNQSLNLDNTATLVPTGPHNNEFVTLTWPSGATLTISEPVAGDHYKLPGTDAEIEFGTGATYRDATLIGPSRNVLFNTGEHRVRLLRAQERVFRVALDSIRDKHSTDRPMFFEYTFIISEIDSTYENIRRAVAEDDYGPEELLRAFRELPEGTLRFKLREVVREKPNIVRLQAGGKAMLFDPVRRQVSFQMTTVDGRPVALERPLNAPADRTGRHIIYIAWHERKGAKLSIDGQNLKDELN
jgi:hypothetical protein